jgi:hypothetical protein
MKILNQTWQLLKKVNKSNFAKTLAGIAVVGIGAAVNFVPAVGPLASPIIMSAGSTIIIGGCTDKIVRAGAGEDPLAHEKNLVAKLRGKNEPTNIA